MKYKTVSGTAHLVADSLSDLETRVGWIADKINKETEGGWQFVGMYPVSATVDHKLASGFSNKLFGGSEDGDYKVNVMVFCKE